MVLCMVLTRNPWTRHFKCVPYTSAKTFSAVIPSLLAGLSSPWGWSWRRCRKHVHPSGHPLTMISEHNAKGSLVPLKAAIVRRRDGNILIGFNVASVFPSKQKGLGIPRSAHFENRPTRSVMRVCILADNDPPAFVYSTLHDRSSMYPKYIHITI